MSINKIVGNPEHKLDIEVKSISLLCQNDDIVKIKPSNMGELGKVLISDGMGGIDFGNVDFDELKARISAIEGGEVDNKNLKKIKMEKLLLKQRLNVLKQQFQQLTKNGT